MHEPASDRTPSTLRRDRLALLPRRRLRPGRNITKAVVEVVELPGGPIVVKDLVLRPWPIRLLLGPAQLDRSRGCLAFWGGSTEAPSLSSTSTVRTSARSGRGGSRPLSSTTSNVSSKRCTVGGGRMATSAGGMSWSIPPGERTSSTTRPPSCSVPTPTLCPVSCSRRCAAPIAAPWPRYGAVFSPGAGSGSRSGPGFTAWARA